MKKKYIKQQQQQLHNEREPHQAQVHLILMSSMFYGATVGAIVSRCFCCCCCCRISSFQSIERCTYFAPIYLWQAIWWYSEGFRTPNLSGITMSMNMWASGSIPYHWVRIDLWMAGSFVCKNGIKSRISNLGDCSQITGWEIMAYIFFFSFFVGGWGNIVKVFLVGDSR